MLHSSLLRGQMLAGGALSAREQGLLIPTLLCLLCLYKATRLSIWQEDTLGWPCGAWGDTKGTGHRSHFSPPPF